MKHVKISKKTLLFGLVLIIMSVAIAHLFDRLDETEARVASVEKAIADNDTILVKCLQDVNESLYEIREIKRNDKP